jgi:hypothetical protein
MDRAQRLTRPPWEPAPPTGRRKPSVRRRIGVTYDDAAASASLADLDFALVNGSTVYGDESSCAVAGSDSFLDRQTTAGPGETVGSGQYLCWEVPSDAIDGMLLRVTHVPTGGEWWFDVTQP